jgi:hypothetical protein
MTAEISLSRIRRQIKDLAGVASVRTNILRLLFKSLKASEGSFGDWERIHFSNAINAFGLNVYSSKQPTYAWLRLCIADLEKATVPPGMRNLEALALDPSQKDIGCGRLLEIVRCLAREVGADIEVEVESNSG